MYSWQGSHRVFTPKCKDFLQTFKDPNDINLDTKINTHHTENDKTHIISKVESPDFFCVVCQEVV